MITETKCSDHPDAPHGFDRNGSHMAGHYVCECSGWTPPASIQERLQELADNSLIDYHTPDSRNRILVQEAADRIDDLTAKLDQYRVEYFQTLRERDEYRKCADDAAMAHKVERDTLKVQIDALTKDAERYRWLFGDVNLSAIKDAADKGLPMPETNGQLLEQIMGFYSEKAQVDWLVDNAIAIQKGTT